MSGITEKFLDCMKQCTPPLPLEGAMAKFIKEGYILKQKRKEGAGLDYRIGPRALVELKRTSVPEFLGQIFGEQVEANRGTTYLIAVHALCGLLSYADSQGLGVRGRRSGER